MRVVVDLKTKSITEDHDFVPSPAPPPTLASYEMAIQMHVDSTAQARGYRDGVALTGYLSSTIPSWSAEAATFIAWRDAVWVYAFTELAKVQNGEREQPSVEVLLGELPAITWPI
jgi:hypothetical protein